MLRLLLKTNANNTPLYPLSPWDVCGLSWFKDCPPYPVVLWWYWRNKPGPEAGEGRVQSLAGLIIWSLPGVHPDMMLHRFGGRSGGGIIEHHVALWNGLNGFAHGCDSHPTSNTCRGYSGSACTRHVRNFNSSHLLLCPESFIDVRVITGYSEVVGSCRMMK